MKLIAISDLHGILPEIIEEADILIIAGDISPLNIQSNLIYIENWLQNIFCPWIVKIPVEKVILIPGNHDYWFQNHGKIQKKIFDVLEVPSDFKITYLHNSLTTFYDNNGDRVKIFGTPYCHQFGNWPFMLDDDKLTEKFKEIPDDIDILVSHDPPFGICDVDITLGYASENKIHKGNLQLTQRINEINPKLVICGHIHSGDHRMTFNNNTNYVNVSLVNEQYKLTYKPFIYDRIYNL